MQTQWICGRTLAPYTSYHIGGKADRLAVCYTSEALIRALDESGGRAVILGKGSNVLVSDDGVRGPVLINRSAAVRSDSDGAVTCDSGLSLTRLARFFAEAGLAGLEWAAGIPGSAGGAAIMNAGAFGGCMADCVESVLLRRGGRLIRLSNGELAFGYRHSAILADDAVIELRLRGKPGDRETLLGRMADFARLRKQKQPTGFSAGSVFRSAEGVAAGKLIEEAGLKGLRAGGARISEKHANFIVNDGFASARDVRQLIDTAKAVVYVRTGIRLREEIRYTGVF